MHLEFKKQQQFIVPLNKDLESTDGSRHAGCQTSLLPFLGEGGRLRHLPAREFPTGSNGRVSGNPGVDPAQVRIPCQNESVWPIRKLDALARLGCEGPWSLVTPPRLRMKICK